MEIFKLFESTIINTEPGHVDTKDLRRDQLLGRYEEAIDTLQFLIEAKENEIKYRRNLVEMLEKSKTTYDNGLAEARQSYANAKKHAPETLDLKDSNKRSNDSQSKESNTTTPFPPLTMSSDLPSSNAPTNSNSYGSQITQPSPHKNSSDLDLSMTIDNSESRSSLDRRLSEFLKTFPNLTQTGLTQPSDSNDAPKSTPGYYTQQTIPQHPPPPPPQQITAATPPVMAMMRFPPPPMMQSHSSQFPPGLGHINNENFETADMDLSDYDESNINGSSAAGRHLIPMVASAMQQGAGGKSATNSQSYISGGQTQYGNSAASSTYGPRLNPLPFDPSIMEPRLRDSSSSSGSRDRHSSSSERTTSGGHWHGGSGSGIPGLKHDRKHSSPSSSQSSGRSSGKRR